jgi:hypothetical protein
MRRRVGVALALPVVVTIALISCGGEAGHPGGAAPPPGPGYGSASASVSPDMRVLSKDDCLALRDHQIEIAVGAALGDAGLDQGARLELEAKLRADAKSKTDEWVKRCSGRVVPIKTLRCWKEATTPETLVACDPEPPPAASGDASPG